MIDYDTITNVARIIKVPRGTLASAIDRGEIEIQLTPGKHCLVNIPDAKRWSGETRKSGPKPTGVVK